MCKFVCINENYIHFVNHLYNRFKKYLEDDYNEDTIAGIINRTYPFFWVILSDNTPAGFVYLDNFIGNRQNFHSAEVTTCIHPKFWGVFTKYCAKIFFKKCFNELGLYKIKALIYPENYRVKTLLKMSGFIKEAVLIKETSRRNQLQNIEVYSLFKNYYEVNENENRI